MNKEEIILKIKKSKKYRDIAAEVIEEKINEYTQKNPNFEKYDEKTILKEIKTKLHKAHGSFQISSKKRERYFEEFKKDPRNFDIINKILETNSSTNERLDNYSQIYSKIFQITGKPKSILDLGCGLNPLSFQYMDLDFVNYYAYDINEKDSIFLNEFFNIMKGKINGESKTMDLTKIENINKLENVDICFMFKLVDVLENKGHKYSEEVIKILSKKCKFIVISFATASLSGKKMIFAGRGWIERMLERIGLKFKKVEFFNEVFYIIKKTCCIPHLERCGLFVGFLDDPRFKTAKLRPNSKELGFKSMDINGEL